MSGTMDAAFVDPANLNLKRVEKFEGGWTGDDEPEVEEEQPEGEEPAQNETDPEAESDEIETETTEEDSDGEEAEEAEAEGLLEDTEEPPQGVGKKAQERFHKLASERAAAQQENALLRQQLAAMSSQLQDTAKLQSELLSTARNAQQEQLRRADKIKRIEELRAAGYDESQLDDIIRSMDAESEMRDRLAKLEASLRDAEISRQRQEYMSALNSEMARALSKHKVSPKEIAQFNSIAYATAVVQKLTPDKAVQAVLAPIIATIPKKETKPAKKQKLSPKDEQALRLSARPGRSGGNRKPGDSASGKTRKKTVHDYESDGNGW